MSTFSVTSSRAVDTRLAEVAELFVAVDAAYGCEPFWPEVRARGYDGAVALLSRPWHAVAFAVDAGQLVGFAALDRPGPHDMELVRVMTHPAAVGKGAATACVAALLEVADSDGIPVWLDVLEHAHGAIALCERLGFRTVSRQAGAHSGRPARQMRRLHPRCLALRDRLEVVPFVDAGDGLLGALADSLDTPGCREFMLGGIPHEMVFVRRERDRCRQTVHTVVLLDGAPVGWCGWARFELDIERVETTTFLAESVWGAGVNAELNHLKWQVAGAGGRKLIFSVNEHNGRSLSALRKAWPALTEARMWEQGVALFSIVGDPAGPPAAYVPWGDFVAAPLVALVSRLTLPYTLGVGRDMTNEAKTTPILAEAADQTAAHSDQPGQ